MNQLREWIQKNAGLLLHITTGCAASILTAVMYDPLKPCHLFINIILIIALIYSIVNFVLTPKKQHWKWKCFVLIAVIIAMNRLYEYSVLLHLCPFLEAYSPAALGACIILIALCILSSIKLLEYVTWSSPTEAESPRLRTKANADFKWLLFFAGIMIVIAAAIAGSVWLNKHDGVSYKEVFNYVVILAAIVYAGTIGILLSAKSTATKGKVEQAEDFSQTEQLPKRVCTQDNTTSTEDINPYIAHSQTTPKSRADQDWEEMKEAAKSKIVTIVKYVFVDLILGFLLSLVTYVKFIPEFLLEIYELIFENEEEDDTAASETATSILERESSAFQETEEEEMV